MWRARQHIARATANEEEAASSILKGRYGDAAEHFKRAAEYWMKVRQHKSADHDEAKACECLVNDMQDKRAFSISPRVYIEMENRLKTAKHLFQKIGESEESSRISEHMMLLRDLVLPALVILGNAVHSRDERKDVYQEALTKFEDIIIQARRIGRLHQVSFASGFVHTCRSYIFDDDSVKIEELELAVARFNEATPLGRWPIRSTEATANKLELAGMKSAREEDYEEAIRNMLEAMEKWKSVGAAKKASWCELGARQYSLEKHLLDSTTVNYLKLADEYLSLSSSFREIGLLDEANWCEA